MGEVWKKIDESYEASDLGRVKSWKGKMPRILKVSLSGKGYCKVAICKNKK